MVGQGKFLGVIYRNQLYNAWKDGKDPKDAHSEVFKADPTIFAQKSTVNLFNWFATHDLPVIEAYLRADNTRKKHAGRKRKFGEIHDAAILQIVCEETRKRLHQINTEFYQTFEDELDAIPADSTIWRHLTAMKKHRKRLNRTNVRKDVSKQLAYLKDVSFVPSENVVDMDGIHFNPKDYLEQYGWATIGEEAYALQLIIRGKTYAVHAAVCKDGFLAWQVFECNMTAAEVSSFIRDKLAPVFPDDAYLILDNASNQKHASVRMAMEGYLQGRYFYCSPYSPELKPIERAFSMVRSWIRNHENDPTESRDLIEQAFKLYSVEGERGYRCHNLFRLYEENYKLFLDEQV
jgi:transposase